MTDDDARPASWRADPLKAVVNREFPGGSAHLYLMPAPDLRAGLRAHAALSGAAPVPPRWTLGYLQSRWGWESRADIEQTLRTFRGRGFPVDALIYDFEWYTPVPDYEVPADGLPHFPDFSWNPELFPEPARQIADYHATGLRTVVIRKPRLGDRDNLAMIHARGWARPAETGSGQKWNARDIDFRNPAVRDWYIEQMRPLARAGIDGWWNDEGEGTFVTYYYWNLAERKLAEQEFPHRRFWSLNRAFVPGMQRLGATVWTGDVHSTWEALAATPTQVLNFGLAGMPFAACDIGGFREESNPELMARWMAAGVFFPMMRTHASHEWASHFPWRFGDEAESAMRAALNLRYRLVPYLYSLAHEASRTGVPIMRPLTLEFPDDELVANVSDQWLLGEGLMAAPLLGPGTRRTVYLPDGDWYAWDTGRRCGGARKIAVTAGLGQIPAFVRAGSIVPLGPEVASTAALPGGPLTLRVYAGRDASFTLYEDDGETDGSANGGVRRVTFGWSESRRELSWKTEGAYAGNDVFETMRVELIEASGRTSREAGLERDGRMKFEQTEDVSDPSGG